MGSAPVSGCSARSECVPGLTAFLFCSHCPLDGASVGIPLCGRQDRLPGLQPARTLSARAPGAPVRLRHHAGPTRRRVVTRLPFAGSEGKAQGHDRRGMRRTPSGPRRHLAARFASEPRSGPCDHRWKGGRV